MSDIVVQEPKRQHLAARPVLTADILSAESEQRKLLMQYVEQQMIEGTDYGVIPGTKSKTLLKPGAEKMTDLFRCSPQFTILNKVEDWDRGLFHYQFKCEILVRETGMVVAEGFGSCSTWESKYRFRNADRLCPECKKPTIIKGKAEYGGGFLCWGKKGGCGAKFDDNDPLIVEQVMGKIDNPDIHDCVNTVLKMAKKRAHVDGAISLARCSDMFTQDAEDLPHDGSAPMTEPAATNPRVETVKSATKPAAKKVDPKTLPAEARHEAARDWWAKVKFQSSPTDEGDTFAIRFAKRINDLHDHHPEFCTAPSGYPDVREYVREITGMSDMQEFTDLASDQIAKAALHVADWLKMCKPTK